MHQPTIDSTRLILRPFRLDDAFSVQKLAGDKLIAATTANIPHPYPNGAAEAWIKAHPENWERGESATFAIQLKGLRKVIGAISLMDIATDSAEIGYWVGVPYWGNGYCSEAVSALVAFAISGLALRCVTAMHLQSNPASGKVLQKCGFSCTGVDIQKPWKSDAFATVDTYEIRHT